MQPSLPRYTGLVRSVMGGLALAAALSTGCQRGGEGPEAANGGNRSESRPTETVDDAPPAHSPLDANGSAVESPPSPVNKPDKPAQVAGETIPAIPISPNQMPVPEPAQPGKPAADMIPTPDQAADRPAEVAPDPSRPVPSAALHPPLVVMSEGHAQTCRVKVGDKLPDVTLPDPDGTEHALTSLLSDKLTVVLFWSMREALGREQFRRLQTETYQPFREAGVHVIAVNVGDASDDVRALYEEAQGVFPCLLDTSKLAFTGVATANLPRTYLLDAQGQILWMDIFYARSTRRELLNAIHYHLRPQPKP